MVLRISTVKRNKDSGLKTIAVTAFSRRLQLFCDIFSIEKREAPIISFVHRMVTKIKIEMGVKSMDDDERNNFNLNMRQFEQFFKKNFPGVQPIDWKDLSNLNSIGNYVEDTLNHSFNRNDKRKQTKTQFSSEVFETHNRVIAKIQIPRHVKLDGMRLYVNGNQIKLENMDENQFIKLPVHVNTKSVKAILRDGILQVQMRKKNTNNNYREVYIRSF
jgi:HSP20 family molecular chaperone IbpA